MRTRRQVLGSVVAMSVAFAGCSSSGMSEESTAEASEKGKKSDVGTSEKEEKNNTGAGLFAPGFNTNTIPNLYTCEGGNISPDLEFSDVSRATNSFAIIMDDPDASGSEPFVHWLIWNIPPNTTTLPEGIPTRSRVELSERGIDPGFPKHERGPALQGTNSSGEIGYTGPCPPPEDSPHTYEITLYSLRSTLDVQLGAKRPALESAIEDVLMGKTSITGEFGR